MMCSACNMINIVFATMNRLYWLSDHIVQVIYFIIYEQKVILIENVPSVVAEQRTKKKSFHGYTSDSNSIK